MMRTKSKMENFPCWLSSTKDFMSWWEKFKDGEKCKKVTSWKWPIGWPYDRGSFRNSFNSKFNTVRHSGNGEIVKSGETNFIRPKNSPKCPKNSGNVFELEEGWKTCFELEYGLVMTTDNLPVQASFVLFWRVSQFVCLKAYLIHFLISDRKSRIRGF